MSTDTHSASVAGFRCEVVTSDTVALPCAHSRLANILPQSADVDCASSHRDDPAVLIGLTLSFVRQGLLMDGPVPEPVMLRLRATADSGNAACRLLLDWLQNRNRDLDQSSASPGMEADSHQPRPSPREPVLAMIPKAGVTLGAIDGRRRGRMRPRDPVRHSKTAIIAAEMGGRADG